MTTLTGKLSRVLVGGGFCLVVLSSLPLLAQVPLPNRFVYDGVNGYVRPGYGYWGSYGWGPFGTGYGGTAAAYDAAGLGQAAQGLGQMAVDVGQYQKENAQAQILYQQAEREYLQTQGLKKELYEQSVAYQKEKDAEADKIDRQKVDAYKRDMSNRAAPHRLSADQFDRQHEIIIWPMVLRHDVFADARFKIDQLFSERTPDNSGPASDSCAAIQKACNEMQQQVNKDVNSLDIDQFITAQHFLASLAYEAQFKVPAK